MPEIGRANYQPPHFCQNDFFYFFGFGSTAARFKSRAAPPLRRIVEKPRETTSLRQVAPAPQNRKSTRTRALAAVPKAVHEHTSRRKRGRGHGCGLWLFNRSHRFAMRGVCGGLRIPGVCSKTAQTAAQDFKAGEFALFREHSLHLLVDYSYAPAPSVGSGVHFAALS